MLTFSIMYVHTYVCTSVEILCVIKLEKLCVIKSTKSAFDSSILLPSICHVRLYINSDH